MQHYELTYIVSIKYLEDDLRKICEKVGALLKEAGAEITADDTLGKQRLAYPIGQATQGTYQVVEFNAVPESIKKLNNQLRLQPEVMRHLIIVKRVKTADEIKREKSVQEKLRREKEDELSRLEEKEKASVKKRFVPVAKLVSAEKPVEVETSLKKKDDKAKVSLDDLDKKLDEILTEEVL